MLKLQKHIPHLDSGVTNAHASNSHAAGRLSWFLAKAVNWKLPRSKSLFFAIEHVFNADIFGEN